MAVTRTMPSGPVFQRNQVDVTIPGMGTETRVGSESVLTGNNLDLDFVTAGRVTAGNRSGVFGIEGSYMLTDTWTETAHAFGSPGRLLASPFTVVGAAVDPAVDNNTSAIVNYSTDMQSAELNLTQRVYSGWNGDASLLYGVKSVWIDEALRYESDNGLSNTQEVSVRNRMIGPQLGVLCEAPFPGWTLDLALKFAITNHSVDKSTIWNGLAAAANDNGAALVSDIGINGTFFITPHLHLRIGYHVLSLTDVALATDNFENSLPLLGAGVADVHDNRGVAYQSLYLGMTLTH
ncbi:MAG TPA: BBP7 family outer membrane beta-barrel protein [Pirellulaceae bacterium]|nr:BBP7 family outer membrane beta-barrel protein [Pirellulaceae bacterium]